VEIRPPPGRDKRIARPEAIIASAPPAKRGPAAAGLAAATGQYPHLTDFLTRSPAAALIGLGHPMFGRARFRTGDRMTEEPGWVPPEADTRRANVARVYDYLLGGSHNYLADQDLGRSLAAVDPNVRAIARANRDFLGRAVRFLARAGIDQFLDIGSGIPTQGNVHEIAQQGRPAARVVYADIDPVAVAHSRAILAGNQHAAVITADLRDPGQILADPVTRQLIDFSQPAGLLLSSVLPFLADDEEPWPVVAQLREALAPGSYLALCHATSDGRPAVTRAMDKVYRGGVQAGGTIRSRAAILRFFDGFELVEPGLVNVPAWRPDSTAGLPADPGQFWVLGGVGRKP
jgi:hypothetical protein